MKDAKTTLFFLRLPVAISMLGHGLVRIPKLTSFTEWLIHSMEKSLFPKTIIQPFAYILPFVEFLIGFSLIIGFRTRETIYTGLTLMAILIFGSASIEYWNAIEAQLIHASYFMILLFIYNNYETKQIK